MTKRRPVKRSLSEIPIEEAHGGSGQRQVVFAKSDAFVSTQFEAMTKGFLPPGAAYDWHQHDGVDEFFLVVDGTGRIEYADGSIFDYKAGDVFYSPADLPHKIENTGNIDDVFFFIRLRE
jgi:mannose-6-phosphate isomerase-like protein (cupin superfamily)